MGTDLDPCAISATKENLEANQIPEGRMEVMIGNIIDDKAVQDAGGLRKIRHCCSQYSGRSAGTADTGDRAIS